MKKLKKLLAMLLVFAFAATLVPTVGMAQEVSANISMTNYANIRGGSYANDTNCQAWASYPLYQKIQNGSGNSSWRFYGQFDLTGYEEILGNAGTNITFKINVGGPASTGKQKNFKIYLINDRFDDYNAANLSYNLAESLGFFNALDSGVVIGSAVDEEFSPRSLYEVRVPAQTILNMLKTGSDDSIVTVAFTTEDTGGTAFNASTCSLTINYDEEKVSNIDYAKEIADGIKWADLSSEAQNSVTQNLTLPTKLYGADVTWTSSDAVVSSSGTVTPDYNNHNVTLTANVSYKGSTASASFNFTVNKITYNYTDIYTGDSTSFVTISGSAAPYLRIDQVSGSVTGKKENDMVYNVHDIEGDGVYINYKIGDTFNKDANNDVMEFSIYLPNGASNVSFQPSILNSAEFTSGSGTAQITIPYYVTTDGIYYSNETWKLCETKPNEWYNIAFVAPKGMATPGSISENDDRICKLYVNGELVHVYTLNSPTSYGFRTFRFYGNDSSMDAEGYYLDNMRLYSGEYVPSRETKPSITSSVYSINNNVITVPGNVSAGQLKASLEKDSDTSLRAYSFSGNTATELADETLLSNGNIIVAASVNGTNLEKAYNYYKVNKLDYSIEANILENGEPSKVFSSADGVDARVVFSNYCADTQKVRVYATQYKNNELIDIRQAYETVSAGETKTISPDMSNLRDIEGSTIKLIVVCDDSFAPYISAVVAKYREANDTPVLYVLGDSIVQEYFDDTYPIQGWGKYLGNYLDSSKIKVDNRARAGWTTDHYLYPDSVYTRTDGLYDEGTILYNKDGFKKTVGESDRYKVWSNVLGELKHGDFVLISLGINDSGTGNVPQDRYIENLTTIYNDATAKGASVILSTPTISGKSWGDGSSFLLSYGAYGELCKAFAAGNNSVCLPLGETLVKTYTDTAWEYAQNNNVSFAAACDYTRSLYHIYAENLRLPVEDGGFGLTDYSGDSDSLHLNERGANRIAKIISELMKNSQSDISSYVK